ncbi:MAG: 3-phosphoshikimate 1-carboxyvinyltransferase [Xanthomonadales bacterium]|nr:3-phosphoshikimate 1-carboxyvinyltransferase [Xanthomonadales bacterium]
MSSDRADRLDWRVEPCGPLLGEMAIPGDKSVSHRAIMLGSLAEGVTTIDGFLEGEDTLATAAIFAQLGVRIEAPAAHRRIVHGVGMQGLQPTTESLDCGNAGTAMRLLAGLLAGQRFDCELSGDASLSRRPMGRVIEPLGLMGARIDSQSGRPPLRIHGGQALRGIDYQPPVASAQIKSALLLAGLQASGTTRVREIRPTRDYTERMLQAFGWPVRIDGDAVSVEGGGQGRGRELRVPADFSSAAFAIVAAAVTPGSDVRLPAVGVHARRVGLWHALQAMGADIQVENQVLAEEGPRADLRIRGGRLRGVDVASAWVPDMIDEFPALFVAAAAAEGVTRIRGAAELRVKESDRLAVMATALKHMGVRLQEYEDGIDIEGGPLQGAQMDSAGDHRCAMALCIAAGLAEGESLIRDCRNVDTSFPDFADHWNALGGQITTMS